MESPLSAADTTVCPSAWRGARVLVAVPDESLRQQITDALYQEGLVVEEDCRALHVLGRLASKDRNPIELLILDISGNPGVGQALVRAVIGEDWDLPVLLLNGAAHRSLGTCCVCMPTFVAAARQHLCSVRASPSGTRVPQLVDLRET